MNRKQETVFPIAFFSFSFPHPLLLGIGSASKPCLGLKANRRHEHGAIPRASHRQHFVATPDSELHALAGDIDANGLR